MRRPLALATVLLSTILPAGASQDDPHRTSAAPPGALPTHILATVNGQPVTLEAVEQRLAALHTGTQEGAQQAFDRDRLMFQVINDVLLGQEARALGMHEDPPMRAQVDEYRDSILRRMVESEAIGDRARPTDEEIRQVFDEEYRRATHREVTAYQREDALEMRRRIERGEDMEALARELSVDPYAQRGGLVSDVAQADLQREVAAVAFGLQPGELAGPFRTEIGWSVLRLQEVRPADPERFADLRGISARMALLQKKERLEAHLARELQRRHPVVVREGVVNAILPEQGPDGRLMPRMPDGDAIAVSVGRERAVTATAYARALAKRWRGVRNLEAATAAAPIILQKLIHDELLVAEALRLELHRRPEVVRAVEARETQLLVPRFLEEVVAGGVQVSQEEMRAHYEAHKGRFSRPPRVRLGQITVATREEGEEVARLLRGGTDLAWLARRKSIDRFRESGGDRGWFEPQVGADEFNDDLLSAEPGTVLDPMGLPGNVMVVQVLAREEQGPYPYDQVSGNVREAVFAEKLQQAMATFMDKLRGRAEVQINEEALAALIMDGAPDGGTGPAGGHGP